MDLFKRFRNCIKGEFKELFPNGTQVEKIASGFIFTEGPVWFMEKQCLLFSDIPANRILALDQRGHVSVFREPSGNSNGLTRDRDGRLVACEHGNRRVSRTERDGSVSIVADMFQGKKLNSPNDVVVKSDGGIYFTDPPYGVSAEQRELDIQGVYYVPPRGNDVVLVAEDFDLPNGLAFSPDETKLYIDDSSSKRPHIRVFDVEDDGRLGNGRLFHSMESRKSGDPDGMKVDACGHVYCTGAGGVWVFDSEGSLLGLIGTPETPSNCAWGDEDRQTLYITAKTSVYKVRTNIPGVGLA